MACYSFLVGRFHSLLQAGLSRRIGHPLDELKNQWGWAGFTTQDIDRCQVTARLIAQIYNWWSLYARLVDTEKHREAVTTRPELLGGVASWCR